MFELSLFSVTAGGKEEGKITRDVLYDGFVYCKTRYDAVVSLSCCVERSVTNIFLTKRKMRKGQRKG